MTEGGIEYSPRSFEQQFHLQKLPLRNGRETTMVDVHPEHEKGKPVVYALGWGGEIIACKPFFKGFFDAGRRVVSSQYPTYTPHFDRSELPEGFSENGYRNALAMVESIEKAGLTDFSLVGHSEGAEVVLMANEILKKRGIKVEDIVLVSPINMLPIGVRRGLTRGLGVVVRELGRMGKQPKIEGGIDVVAKNPVNAGKEAMDTFRVDMRKLVAQAIADGQQVGIIAAKGDGYTRTSELGDFVAKVENDARQEVVRPYIDEQTLTNPERRNELEQVVASASANENPLVVTIPVADIKEAEIVERIDKEREEYIRKFPHARVPDYLKPEKSEKPGHFLFGFFHKNKNKNPAYYVPLVCDMLTYFEKKRTSAKAHR